MKTPVRFALLAAFVLSAGSCASMFNVRRLGDDHLDEGFASALLMRVQVLDHSGTIGKSTMPNMWFTVLKPGEAPLHEIPNPDGGSFEARPEGAFMDTPYTIESRAFPFQIEGGAFTAVGVGPTTSTKLSFAKPIAVTPRPGQLAHLGVIRIEIHAVNPDGTVRFDYALARDPAVEQRDLDAFRARFPSLAKALRTE